MYLQHPRLVLALPAFLLALASCDRDSIEPIEEAEIEAGAPSTPVGTWRAVTKNWNWVHDDACPNDRLDTTTIAISAEGRYVELHSLLRYGDPTGKCSHFVDTTVGLWEQRGDSIHVDNILETGSGSICCGVGENFGFGNSKLTMEGSSMRFDERLGTWVDTTIDVEFLRIPDQAPVAIRLPNNLDIMPFGGVYSSPQVATLHQVCEKRETSIHYTVDGSVPTASSPTYKGESIDIADGMVIKAVVVFDGVASQVSSATYHYDHSIPWNDSIRYGNLRDKRDGRSYRTVRIGNQTWMAENLNYDVWGVSTNYLDLEENGRNYGRLYEWSFAMGLPASCTENDCQHQLESEADDICPDGWHIPDPAEWDTLVSRAGGPVQGAVNLKASTSWGAAARGNDRFGFRILPAGSYSSEISRFDGLGSFAGFWVRRQYSEDFGWLREVSFSTGRNIAGKTQFQSVRCVAD